MELCSESDLEHDTEVLRCLDSREPIDIPEGGSANIDRFRSALVYRITRKEIARETKRRLNLLLEILSEVAPLIDGVEVHCLEILLNIFYRKRRT